MVGITLISLEIALSWSVVANLAAALGHSVTGYVRHRSPPLMYRSKRRRPMGEVTTAQGDPVSERHAGHGY